MDLFEYQNNKIKDKKPLADRLRPKTLEDFIGQEEILGQNGILYRAIKKDCLSSLILYGPSGTGKTSLAKIIANTTKSHFETLNATGSASKDLKQIMIEAKNRRRFNIKTILFIDEIHRYNKAQQDLLLPYLEDGSIILIGATTENPYFEINKAIISRSLVYKFEPISKNNIKNLILKALSDCKDGIGELNISIEEEALEFLAINANGDCRVALNHLELIAPIFENDKITLKDIENCFQNKYIKYDKDGDNHYDYISAFIKSIRGSDIDASLYYLARMLLAGEDIKFIARRLIILASEDIGNANPQALQLATSNFYAISVVGMPEARIILAQTTIYLASSPKSNASYLAIEKALQDAKIPIKTIPYHIKDAHYQGSEKFGNGIDYKYPHNYKNSYVEQQYLPDEVKDSHYYFAKDIGYEKQIKSWIKNLKEC